MKNFAIYSGISFTALFLWLAFRHTSIANQRKPLACGGNAYVPLLFLLDKGYPMEINPFA